MKTELKVLGWAIALGFLYVFVAAGMTTFERGLRWNAGNRDGDSKPLSKPTERARRASLNFLESFPFYAAATLAVVLAGHDTPDTALGAKLYFWARVVYLPIYIVGITYVRTLVYAVSLWGILKLLVALL
jgi:uncharacterized MAPEG superfamily protein